MSENFSKRSLFYLTAGLAFCSISYELIFVDLFTAIFGSQVKQFNTIVSLFTFTLGLGALAYQKIRNRYKFLKIISIVEVGLFSLGLCGPFLLLASMNSLGRSSLLLLSYSITGFIGLLSGFELPLMFDRLKNAHGEVLAYDYIGMILGTIIVPLLLIPHMGPGASIILISLTNMLLLMHLIFNQRKELQFFCYALYTIACGACFYYRFHIRELYSALYLGSLS